MTLFRLGYVAMSKHVKNASPSKTMSFAQFSKIADREAAIAKLERIAQMNLHNCLRLLRHNAAHNIAFFRLSSKLIPLANHPSLKDWAYMEPLREALKEIKCFLMEHPNVRVDFHPDHFVLLNSTDTSIFKNSIQTLGMHYQLLKGMGIDPAHRCVLHVGGGYDDKEQALEQFVHNWGLVPPRIQKMVILENDDKVFNVRDTLYLCEKLGIPFVFDYHHYLVNHTKEESIQEEWPRIAATWGQSELPVKVHISSPKSEADCRAHAELIDLEMFWDFVGLVKGTVAQIDVMIEAKGKDEALFQLVRDLKAHKQAEWINDSSFIPF
ncbi:UV DNA damage repair endonuclease UvsE [Bacillus testis]|uniref:UV DNA damage repair endonuclease UvsE n=1 Tax=Bacillus testis TaxID=1622072 RepID=UPI00067F199B|nr:UV DNA damage repair endonuclease UvsE [Bacillus testis]